jgi:predicted permease
MLNRLVALFRRSRLDGELSDEVGFHLSMLEEEFRARGMPPADARNAARREFGGVAQTQEKYRERRGIPWIETSLRDLRYALRGLRRNPGFTAAAVLSLALGIGANTAVFSLLYAVALRTLPVTKPSQLVSLHQGDLRGSGFCSPSLYLELRKRADLFTGVLAIRSAGPVRFSAGSGGSSGSARAESVSTNYFDVLGIPPAAGRLFHATDGESPATYRPAVLSYGLWKDRFGADPKLVGRTLPADGGPLTVIGVAAPGFRGVDVEGRADLWLPMKIVSNRNAAFLRLMARRRAQVSIGQVQSAVDVLMAQYRNAVYGSAPNSESRRRALEQKLHVRDGSAGLSYLREEFGAPLGVLMAASGLLLLATCGNLVHLLLARGAAHRKELAVRYSLGATRGRLVRQALTESLLIAGMGGALGTLVASAGARAVMLFVPEYKAGTLDVTLDGAALALMVATSFGAALVFGLVPAWRSTAIDPMEGLRSNRPDSRGRPAFRGALVAAQVALSVVLVAMAALFGHSLARLRSIDLGFTRTNAITFWVAYPRAWNTSEVRAARDRFLAEATALPGVLSASYSSPDVLQGESWAASVRVMGVDGAKEPRSAFLLAVGPRFFQTLGSAPTMGRDFDRSDTAGADRVAIVNQEFLRKFLPGEPRPVGRQIALDAGDGAGAWHIVGIVRDIAHGDIRQPAAPAVYVPDGQIENPFGDMPAMIVSGRLPSAALLQAVRRAMAGIHPELAPRDAGTLRGRIDESIFEERTLAALGGVFGGLALALAGIGLYGLVAYGTARRSAEIGVRIALGARRGSILRLVLRDALGLILIGLTIGLPLALAAARAVRSILFGIPPGDPLALISTACALLAIGLAAAFLPARRAAGMDPLASLRQE